MTLEPMTVRSRRRPTSLFLLARREIRLPPAGLLAWRRGDGLDLRLLGFLNLPIASLLALGHVGLPGFVDTLDTNVRSTVRRDQPRARLKTRVSCVPGRSSRVQAPRSAPVSRQTCCVPALTCRGRKARPTPSHAHLSPRSCVGELSSASPVVRSWRLQLRSCHTVATRT